MLYVSNKSSNSQVGYNSVDVSTVHKKNESLYFEALIDYMINSIQKEKVTSAAKFHGIILGD